MPNQFTEKVRLPITTKKKIFINYKERIWPITNDGRVGNGEKKTRQGRGKNTKFGTKPQTHLGPVPKKTLSKYKKRRKG